MEAHENEGHPPHTPPAQPKTSPCQRHDHPCPHETMVRPHAGSRPPSHHRLHLTRRRLLRRPMTPSMHRAKRHQHMPRHHQPPRAPPPPSRIVAAGRETIAPQIPLQDEERARRGPVRGPQHARDESPAKENPATTPNPAASLQPRRRHPRRRHPQPQRQPCQRLQRAAPFADTSKQTASCVLRANTCPPDTTGVVQHLPGNTSARPASM